MPDPLVWSIIGSFLAAIITVAAFNLVHWVLMREARSNAWIQPVRHSALSRTHWIIVLSSSSKLGEVASRRYEPVHRADVKAPPDFLIWVLLTAQWRFHGRRPKRTIGDPGSFAALRTWDVRMEGDLQLAVPELTALNTASHATTTLAPAH